MVDDMDVSDLDDAPRRKTFEPPAPEEAFADSIPILDGVEPLDNTADNQLRSVNPPSFDSPSIDTPGSGLPSSDLPSFDPYAADSQSTNPLGIVDPTPEPSGLSAAEDPA